MLLHLLACPFLFFFCQSEHILVSSGDLKRPDLAYQGSQAEISTLKGHSIAEITSHGIKCSAFDYVSTEENALNQLSSLFDLRIWKNMILRCFKASVVLRLDWRLQHYKNLDFFSFLSWIAEVGLLSRIQSWWCPRVPTRSWHALLDSGWFGPWLSWFAASAALCSVNWSGGVSRGCGSSVWGPWRWSLWSVQG